MITLLEKLMEQDFEDTFKPADKKEIEKRFSGGKFRWVPVDMKGYDGKIYHILAVFSRGYDWENVQYFSVSVDTNIIVLTHEPENIKGNKVVDSLIIKGGDTPIKLFNRRPYIRKDGSFVVEQHSPHGSRLDQQYGIGGDRVKIVSLKKGASLVAITNEEPKFTED